MEPGKLYHLYTHANGSENLFRSGENYRYFLRRYQHFITPVADTLVYCLMPNHLHFLIRIKEEKEIINAFAPDQTDSSQASNSTTSNKTFKVLKNLEGLNRSLNGGLNTVEKRISQQFRNLFNSYTKSYNKAYHRRGSLFIPNFKRKEIADDDYISNVIAYIHNNPVHHGFVKKSSDWLWSSYNHFFIDAPSIVKREAILNWFGTCDEFLKFHQRRPMLNIDIEDF